MAFVNTKDIIGEQALFDALVSHQLTEFNDDCVTELGAHALRGHENLRSVNFPSLTKIGQGAFMECSNLESIDIGATLTSIGAQFASSDAKLKALILRSTSGVCPTVNAHDWLSGYSFAKLQGLIYVPRSMVNSYKTTRYWIPYRFAIRAIEDMPVLDAETIDLTWAQIKAEIEDESFFSAGYSLGDLKKVTYTDGATSHTVYFEIAKINTVDKYVDFILVGPDERLNMNSSNTPIMYSNSLVKARLDDIYANELPSDLKAAITPVTKKYYSYDGTIESVTAPLWLLNTKDVNFTGSDLKDSEGEEYSEFNTIGSGAYIRTRFRADNGATCVWWLGSAHNNTSFMAVNVSGNSYSRAPAMSGASVPFLVFGFRIQKST